MISIIPDVSVILPTLHPNNDYFRCIQSVRSALAGQVSYEIICVVRDTEKFIGLDNPDIHFLQEDAPGIYSAMNQGVHKANGQYLYFIGQDDILLPAVANAINQGKICKADIILADVFFGELRIFKNNPTKNTLIWNNWCHQGILYDRLKFTDAGCVYPVQFKVQADHYVNIVFRSIHGLKIFKYNGCIAWYSSNGFSSRTLDFEFRKVFPKLVLKHFGFIYFYIVVIRRALLKIFKLSQGIK